MPGTSTITKGLDLMKLFALRDQFGATFKKGDVIYAPGQPADQFFVLMRGHVQLESDGAGSEMLDPGNVFGEIDLFAGQSRTEQATALEDSAALAFTSETASTLAEATPSFALVVIRKTCERLARAEALIASGALQAAAPAGRPCTSQPARLGPGARLGRSPRWTTPTRCGRRTPNAPTAAPCSTPGTSSRRR